MVLEINKEDFDEQVINSKTPVLVDFYADWCSFCDLAEPVVEELSGECDDVKFCKINTDNARDFAEGLGIFSLPTFVLFDKGKEVKRLIGIYDKGYLEEMLEKL